MTSPVDLVEIGEAPMAAGRAKGAIDGLCNSFSPAIECTLKRNLILTDIYGNLKWLVNRVLSGRRIGDVSRLQLCSFFSRIYSCWLYLCGFGYAPGQHC